MHFFISYQEIQLDATTAWHILRILGKANLTFWSSLTSYTLNIWSTLASHSKYTFGSLSPLQLRKEKEDFGGGC